MRRHALFIGVFILIAAVRFTILLASQTHVHSDEAIIGLMGKHILEGRYFPFYMYGQPYNAGAAWEAYLAAIAFAFFGVGVIALKSCIVVLSLLCLFLFYRMCQTLYDERTVLLATIVFALTPSLLKWHFQVRGYSWYFLSIPVLTMLFVSIQSVPNPKQRMLFLFGLASGVSVWSLELAIPLVAALWMLLILRGRLSVNNAAAGLAGFAMGYMPVIAYNLLHHFDNWRYLIIYRPGGGFHSLFQLSTFGRILLDEMPKFFGPDTVLWYYPDKPASGYVFYAIGALAVTVAMWPFLKSPLKIMRVLRGDSVDSRQKSDFDMLVLMTASFVPYLSLPIGVPSYFFGGCFFLAALTGRLLERCFVCSKALVRSGGAGILAVIVITGSALMIDTARHNQIETLTLCDHGENYCMTRIPGADLERVERDLRDRDVTGVWTTVSFVYPLLFECGEEFAVSDAIFGYPYRVYPPVIPWREPKPEEHFAIVVESDSPFRAPLEARFLQAAGVAPMIREYGNLAVIEGRSR